MKGITIASVICALFVVQTQWVEVKSSLPPQCGPECGDGLRANLGVFIEGRLELVEQGSAQLSSDLQSQLTDLQKKTRSYVAGQGSLTQVTALAETIKVRLVRNDGIALGVKFSVYSSVDGLVVCLKFYAVIVSTFRL